MKNLKSAKALSINEYQMDPYKIYKIYSFEIGTWFGILYTIIYLFIIYL